MKKAILFTAGLLFSLTTMAQSEVVERPEVEASYPGGMPAMVSYITDNVKYPKSAQEEKIQGTVYVRFTVAEDGTIRDAEIMRGVRKDIDQEALRIVSNMPKWEPAKNNDKAVASSNVMPVRFTL